MQLSVLDNRQKVVYQVLSDGIRVSNDVRIAVAFVSQSGYNLLAEAISQSLSRGGKIELLVGMDLQGTL